MKQGQQIIYTASQLGTVASPNSTRFEEPVVMEGDLGEYVGPHPNPTLAEQDWHMTRPLYSDDTVLYCPVHTGQFKARSTTVKKVRTSKQPGTKSLEELLRF